METKARYILVGAFTLGAIAALLGFLLWLAQFEINRSYAQYDIVFETVSGLSQDSVVRYNGVDVGKVLSIDLDRQNPQFVRVRIEIRATTPVRQDTRATLSSQGVTGVSFVALEGGSPMSNPLQVIPPAEVPVIVSQPSVVQELTNAAPNLLKEAIALIEDVRQFTTPQNREAVAAILKNVETVSSRVDAIAARAERLVTAAEGTLARADAALGKAEAAFSSADAVITGDIPGLVDELKSTVADVGATATELKTFARSALPQYRDLASDARKVIANIGAVADRIGRDPGRFLLGTQTPEYRN
ncbi:MlaD family protein [Tabrizicola sp.]|uniref:MlaD family protein n=1 Tax=Tabrizicola sp. TaxID=2005166 RepID=UPI002732F9C4|nr:MlaD family protein [Tabrizicola sp.]MDP3197975.1 MlaD family protein [Tabrizicola sp.]